MHKFVRNLITEWRRMDLPVSDATIVVAVSGGADSASLLFAVSELVRLKKLDLRVVIAHFNHKLRAAESTRDEDFVKTLTAAKGLELAIGRGSVSAEGNLEQNARNARYAFLAKTAENLRAYAVLTAHTQNDQAETFLINLIRGSGLTGLGGMKRLRRLSERSNDGWNTDLTQDHTDPLLPFSKPEILLARPLLNWAKRTDTENYCRENSIAFRYDSMNENLAFSRIRVRKILIPLLEEFNPKIIDTLSQTARLIQIENECSVAVTEEARPAPEDVLDQKQLKTMEKAELYRKIRQWLEQHRGDRRLLEMKHIEAIERLIFSRKSGRAVELPGGDSVSKREGKLIFANLKVDK